MAAEDSLLYNIDTVIVAGLPVAFESGTGEIMGAARFKGEVVPSATGRDFVKRTRVPTSIKLKLQFGNTVDPAWLAGIKDAQITARDSQSGRRAMMNSCSFAELGAIGAGSVEVTFNVLEPIQWL